MNVVLLCHADSFVWKLRKKTLHLAARDPYANLSRFIMRAETFFRFVGV